MPDWKRHPHFDAVELRVGDLLARVKYIRTYGAEYMWAVLKVDPNTPDFAELLPTQYEELAAGDTVGDFAYYNAIADAEIALDDILYDREHPSR